MLVTSCPECGKKQIFYNTPTLNTEDFPYVTCKSCKHRYIPEKFIRRASSGYKDPRKCQIPLAGLPAGIIGLIIIIIGMLDNSPILVLIGGVLFSFWILLIAMALCLWKEILRRSEEEYRIIKEECKER